MEINPKDPKLNKLAAISLIFGLLMTIPMIINGSDKRAQMNAVVAEQGFGYNGNFQIIGSIMGGLLYSAGLFILLTVVVLILESKKKKNHNE